MPRASLLSLFGRWIEADDSSALQQLASLDFEPMNLVLVARTTATPLPKPEELASRSNLVVKAYFPKRN